MAKYRLTPEDPLRLDIAEEVALVRTPDVFRVKGMFMNPLVRQLGADWAALSKQLKSPPRMGRYLPFHDYPQSDLMRMIYRLGRRDHPHLLAFELFRRYSRKDFQVFAESMLGRTMLSIIADAGAALLKFPDVYRRVAPGDWTFTTKELNPNHIELRMDHHPGIWGVQLGQVEAIVASFGARPTVEIDVDEPADKPRSNVRFSIRIDS